MKSGQFNLLPGRGASSKDGIHQGEFHGIPSRAE